MPGVELRIVDEAGAAIAAAETPGGSRCACRRSATAIGCAGDRSRTAAAASGRALQAGRLVCDRRRIRPRRRRLLSSPRPQRRHAARVRASGFRRRRSRTRSPASASIAESAAVLGESDIGLAEIVLYRRAGAGRGRRRLRSTAARERLSQALPRYKQPRRFEVVADLPRTATGKVQRHKLRERLRRDRIEAGNARTLIDGQREDADPAAARPLRRGLRPAGRRGLPQSVQALVQALPEELAAADDDRRSADRFRRFRALGHRRRRRRTGRSRRATNSSARSR